MSYELGKLLIRQKKFKQALKYFQTILKNKKNDLRANFQIGKIFYELNDLHKSFAYFKKCKTLKSNDPNILFNYALVLQNIGEIEQAKKEYLNLISINPKDIKSYYALSSINIDYITNELSENLKFLNQSKSLSDYERSLINFIFSKIEKKKQNLENEIEYLKKSHKLCNEANKAYNAQSNYYYTNIISKKFNQIKFEGEFNKIDNFNNNNHIFIIGLPRSGSTLVETIIAHNANEIVSVGEFHAFNTSILEQIGGLIYSKNFNYNNFEIKINNKQFQNSLVEKYDNFQKKIYLDKSLENFFNIELILNFFPNSKFIHTFRDINDAIIGIYQTMLPKLSWSHDLKDIINYIKIYKSTIEYFKKKYPNNIIDVNLSRLTNHKETEVKKILEFCKIKYTKNFLSYEKNEKLFNKTNSFLQVREKIKSYKNNKYKSYYYLLDNIKK